MSIRISNTISALGILLLIPVTTVYAKAGKPVEHATREQKLAAMSCFIRYQWFQSAVLGRMQNIPEKILFQRIDSQLSKYTHTDWAKSARVGVNNVYKYPPQTKKVYSQMGGTLLQQCLNEKKINQYRNKVASCIEFANIARLIFLEMDSGTGLRDAEIKMRPLMKKLHIDLKLVKDIYSQHPEFSSYRMNLWTGCAANIDGGEKGKR